MKYAVLIIPLIAIGCAEKPEEYTPTFVPLVQSHTTALGDTVWTASKPGASKRILMIHGLTVDHTYFYKSWQGAIIDHLLNQGFEVVFIDLKFTTDPSPYTRLRESLDSSYQATFQARITDVLNYADTLWGIRAQVMIGGVSFGGLHAMMGCLNEPRCTKYMALIPVVDLRALVGFQDLYLANFTPFNYENSLSQRQGYMQYCGADAAVSPEWSRNFVSQMTNLTVDHYDTFPHGITKAQAWDVNTWIDKVVL